MEASVIGLTAPQMVRGGGARLLTSSFCFPMAERNGNDARYELLGAYPGPQRDGSRSIISDQGQRCDSLGVHADTTWRPLDATLVSAEFSHSMPVEREDDPG